MKWLSWVKGSVYGQQWRHRGEPLPSPALRRHTQLLPARRLPPRPPARPPVRSRCFPAAAPVALHPARPLPPRRRSRRAPYRPAAPFPRRRLPIALPSRRRSVALSPAWPRSLPPLVRSRSLPTTQPGRSIDPLPPAAHPPASRTYTFKSKFTTWMITILFLPWMLLKAVMIARLIQTFIRYNFKYFFLLMNSTSTHTLISTSLSFRQTHTPSSYTYRIQIRS